MEVVGLVTPVWVLGLFVAGLGGCRLSSLFGFADALEMVRLSTMVAGLTFGFAGLS